MAEPLGVQLPCLPFDVTLHPSEPLVCTALISGSVQLDRFTKGWVSQPRRERGIEAEDAEEASSLQRCWRKKGHKEACRAVTFMEDGKSLLSASSDESLVMRSTETGKRVWANMHAHSAALNRLEALSESTVASGDDEGEIKVWDVRQPSCCAAMSVHDDFIADMYHANSRNKLLAVSGDGTLSVFDLKQFKKEARSEYAEDELLSVTVVKGGRKVVCGSQEGVLLLYSWGHFSDCSDRFPGHPQSIDALIKLDEDTVITGSQDGLIRLISILPNTFQGVIGQHMDYPIERLALSGDGKILASASHDNMVKLWDIDGITPMNPSNAEEEGDEEEEEEEEETAEAEEEATAPGSTKKTQKRKQHASDEEDGEGEDGPKRKPKKHERKKIGKGKATPNRSSTFFADL